MPLKLAHFKHIGTCDLPTSTTPEFSKRDCGDLKAVGAYSWDIGSALQLKCFDNIPCKCSGCGIESFCPLVESNH